MRHSPILRNLRQPASRVIAAFLGAVWVLAILLTALAIKTFASKPKVAA
jgi:hypothetical protein